MTGAALGTFDCADCGETFSDLTELFGHDPAAEAADAYPGADPAGMVTVCDDCYARRIAASSTPTGDTETGGGP